MAGAVVVSDVWQGRVFVQLQQGKKAGSPQWDRYNRVWIAGRDEQENGCWDCDAPICHPQGETLYLRLHLNGNDIFPSRPQCNTAVSKKKVPPNFHSIYNALTRHMKPRTEAKTTEQWPEGNKNLNFLFLSYCKVFSVPYWSCKRRRYISYLHYIVKPFL